MCGSHLNGALEAFTNRRTFRKSTSAPLATLEPIRLYSDLTNHSIGDLAAIIKIGVSEDPQANVSTKKRNFPKCDTEIRDARRKLPSRTPRCVYAISHGMPTASSEVDKETIPNFKSFLSLRGSKPRSESCMCATDFRNFSGDDDS